jgi:hypothetical protein
MSSAPSVDGLRSGLAAVIDNEELLVAILGSDKVATFKEVKLTSMRLARVVREVIAEDLDGSLPPTGKQFLRTRCGLFRLASRSNSDNTTERQAHCGWVRERCRSSERSRPYGTRKAG